MNIFRKKVSKTSLSDEEILETYKKSHDKALLDELFRRYIPLAFGVCMNRLRDEDDAKDAVIQVFEKLLDQIDTLEVKNFPAWLYRVTSNFCLMELRKKKVVQQNRVEIEFSSPELVENYHEIHLTDEESSENRYQEVDRALEELSTEQRTCIELFYVQEKSYQEIATLTGYTPKQVKSYIQNGRRRLKKLLGQKSIFWMIFLITF
ncbi:MAG: sigma-70 family RNA polymerase sigma factor [Cytophagales bacterium]|nr:sigma-70 family RNA polymerase sigma factor [Cytophagales bacterium]MDW8383677.1 sigma-70 family RNA polymerase sigma factor [Flammeovirgaceae bacterium]